MKIEVIASTKVGYSMSKEEAVDFSGKSSKNNPSEKSHGTKGSAVKKI